MTETALFDKAGRALAAGRAACERGDAETASDRAYYAVYYGAWAMLERAGVPRPKTHNGMIAELARVYVKTGRVSLELGATLSRLQGLRLVADYTRMPFLSPMSRVRWTRPNDSSPQDEPWRTVIRRQSAADRIHPPRSSHPARRGSPAE
ncbi:HEPN domain-containing protein [Thiohalocapsa sp. ML1]|uniref:HEPN domain-containing protein n=1 Tax=Thiohalocapsa sp. ML1 TaxID=1431688 RepID=UPI00138F98E5